MQAWLLAQDQDTKLLWSLCTESDLGQQSLPLLEEWGATGPTESWDQHRKVKVRSSLRHWGHYLSGLRSYLMEHELAIEVFQSLRLKQFYEAESPFSVCQNSPYFYHQRDLIQNLNKHHSQYKRDQLDTAYKVAWAGSNRLLPRSTTKWIGCLLLRVWPVRYVEVEAE